MTNWDDEVRPGPGGPKLKKTCVSVTEAQYQALLNEARKSNIGISGVVRRLIVDVLMEK